MLEHIDEDIEAIRRELIRDFFLEDLVSGGSRGFDYTEQMLDRLEVLDAEPEDNGVDETAPGNGLPGAVGTGD